MSVAQRIIDLKKNIPNNVTLVAVSKTKPNELILEAYQSGHKIFGENKVQELTAKHEALPKDIEWHLIGHLQSNKVKYIAPFVALIHSVDSFKLLEEINKQAQKNNRVINCLLQIYIAKEETKFGLNESETLEILNSKEFSTMNNINIIGLMGMASNTDNIDIVKNEFKGLKVYFEKLKAQFQIKNNLNLTQISMGMSSDYKIAIEEGSTIIRVGSSLFGNR
ncbi:MAG: YggS family pyridoxal phosphate-dependent enzyme [Bacteroidota bacterium]